MQAHAFGAFEFKSMSIKYVVIESAGFIGSALTLRIDLSDCSSIETAFATHKPSVCSTSLPN